MLLCLEHINFLLIYAFNKEQWKDTKILVKLEFFFHLSISPPKKKKHVRKLCQPLEQSLSTIHHAFHVVLHNTRQLYF